MFYHEGPVYPLAQPVCLDLFIDHQGPSIGIVTINTLGQVTGIRLAGVSCYTVNEMDLEQLKRIRTVLNKDWKRFVAKRMARQKRLRRKRKK